MHLDESADSYNLLDKPFIPVLWMDGRSDRPRVGIRQALTEAGSIRQIAASNPMDNIALLRFLLAVLYWCRGDPPDQDATDRILAAGQFPPEWFAKLDQQMDCFNLLGDGKRFYQDPTARRERPTTDLLQEVPTGNNFWHFRHSADGRDGLCAGCCALGLLRLPLFSVSGLPDLKAGINGTPPVYVVPVGRSLRQTLCLNWVRREPLGAPAWEHAPAPQPGQDIIPLLSGLTMLSRRVWLHPPDREDGSCIACGRGPTVLFRRCEYQSAGNQQDDRWADPHVIYLQRTKATEGKTSRKALTAPDLTRSSFRLDKPWVPVCAQIALSSKGPVDLLVVGFATDKAKNIDVWERTLRLPAHSANQADPTSPADKVERWQEEGGKLAFRMKPRGSKSRGMEFTAALAAIRPHVESRVSATVTDLLTEPDSAWAQAVDEYRLLTPVIARSLAPGFTTRAARRRHEITNALPDMTPKPTARLSRPKVRKGGDE